MVDIRHYISGERLCSDALASLVLSGEMFASSEQGPTPDQTAAAGFAHTLLLKFHELGRFPRNSATEQIHYIGKLLDTCFGSLQYKEKKVAWIQNRGNTLFSRQKLQQGDLLIQEINVPKLQTDTSSSPSCPKDCCKDSEEKMNIRDETSNDGGQAAAAAPAAAPTAAAAAPTASSLSAATAVPIFACTTASEEEVVGLVLSIYF
ncbi:unnamed protein product, partial [Amoebophrya sp. A25]|eukprot:GSA25T00007945001.1